MKEIGGYFELEQLISNEYHKNLVPLNTGRNALIYLIKARGIKKLYIPYFLCGVVRDSLIKNNYAFEYYSIDNNFMPVFHKELGNNEYLYVVNYYGQLTNDRVIYLKQQYGQVIIDNTQGFFQKPVKGVDTIYSCRKFFGVPDGAYLSTDVQIKEDLERDVSKDRMTHILGRHEGTGAEYYSDYKNNIQAFKSEPLKYMSKLTHNILGAIDYERTCEIRNRNYSYLESKLGAYNKLKLKTPIGPFAYPFHIENGIEIRKELAKKKIYVPLLWPNVLSDAPESSIEYNYAANILPLPCDQRYGAADMEYIEGELRSFEAGSECFNIPCRISECNKHI